MLITPNNGNINCGLRDNGLPSFRDICIITCNTGYELIGNETRTCQSDGSWSGNEENIICSAGKIHLCMHCFKLKSYCNVHLIL